MLLLAPATQFVKLILSSRQARLNQGFLRPLPSPLPNREREQEKIDELKSSPPIESGVKTAVFDPILFEAMPGGVQTRSDAVQNYLPVVSHPNFIDRLHTNHCAPQNLNALRKTIDGAVVNCLKDKKVALAN